MPQSDITAIVAAVEARAWYPAIAGAITLLLVLLRRVAPETWARLPRRWQWVPAVVLAALAAFADAATSGVTWRVALALTTYSVLSAGMTAIGLHHAAKRITDGGPDSTVPVVVEPEPGAPASPSTLRSGAVGLVFLALGMLTALTLAGCSGTFEEAHLARVPSAIAAAPSPSDVAYCRDLDSSRTTWGAVAKGSAALAGASGLVTLPVDSEQERVALASATLAAGAVSVVAVYVSESKGAAWVRDCSR